MAKPLGAKTLLIREAIKAHPRMGNTELAETINASDARKEDKIEVKAQDVAAQKQAMKKPGAEKGGAPAAAGKSAQRRGGKRGGQKRAATTAERTLTAPKAVPVATASPVELIDRVLDLAQAAGGFDQLRRLVDRLGQMQGPQ